MQRSQCKVVSFTEAFIVGVMEDAAQVLFARIYNMDTKKARLGDTFSFIPQPPVNLHRKDIKWYGGHPKFVSHEEKPGELDYNLLRPVQLPASLLPCRHAKNFDSAGNLILPVRPRDLAAQRELLAKHAGANTN